jgi:hypothetical protein
MLQVASYYFVVSACEDFVGAILNTKLKISGTLLVVIWCLCSRTILLVVIHICVFFRIVLLPHRWFQEFFVCWYFVTLMFVLGFEGAQCSCSMTKEQDFIWNGMIENESFPIFVAIVGINQSGVRSGGGLASKTSNELASDKDEVEEVLRAKKEAIQ